MRRMARALRIIGAPRMVGSFLLCLSTVFAVRAEAPAAVGSVVRAGEAEGLSVQVKVQGPAGQDTELQIACVFQYVEGAADRAAERDNPRAPVAPRRPGRQGVPSRPS
jgi:hypothetical protein